VAVISPTGYTLSSEDFQFIHNDADRQMQLGLRLSCSRNHKYGSACATYNINIHSVLEVCHSTHFKVNTVFIMLLQFDMPQDSFPCYGDVNMPFRGEPQEHMKC